MVRKSIQKPITCEMLEEIKSAIQQANTIQSVYDSIRPDHLPASISIKKQLKMTWNQFLESLDITPSTRTWSKEILIELHRKATKDFGYTPSSNEFFSYVSIHVPIFQNHFSTYQQLCDESGCNRKCVEKTEVPESDTELLEIYRTFSLSLGRAATGRDLNNSTDIYNFEIFRSRFGSLHDLQILARFEPPTDRRKISKEICEEVMLTIYMQHGRINYGHLKSLLPFNVRTLLRRYNTTSIIRVWEEIERITQPSEVIKKNKKTIP